MDLATVIGIVLSFGLVVAAILTGSSLMVFISVPSALIVLGGTIGAALVNYPLSYVIGVIGVIKNTFFSNLDTPASVIDKFKDYANRARREGILSLEPLLKEIDDDYMRKGLQLTVDGLEPQTIQEIMETEISYLQERHETGADVVAVLGTLAPAMGMIGTVIGLVQMLQTMSDPSTIGPAMAVALLTTFYGAVLANVIFLPLARKLEVRSDEDALFMEIMAEGVISIQRGEHPSIVKEKLQAFLAPKLREQAG
jgi:chemotaxis protein MotA